VAVSENVGPSVDSGDAFIKNLTTNALVPDAFVQVNYNAATNTASFTFPGYAHGALPDGNYKVTIPPSSFEDLAGNELAAGLSGTFYFVAGDANHDRTVELTDFTILAANFNGQGKTFDQGDFNYDGVVDLTDFTILASKFNYTLPATTTATVASAPAAPAAPTTTTQTSLFSDQAMQDKDLLPI